MLPAIIAAIVSGLIVYFVLRPKCRITQKVNEEIQQENLKIEKENQSLKTDKNKLENKIESLISQSNIYKNNIEDLKTQAEQTAKAFYNQCMEKAELRLDADLAIEETSFHDACHQAEESYKEALEDYMNNFQKQFQDKEQKLAELGAVLADLQDKTSAAIAEAKRRQEMENQYNFYRIIISEEDKKEIEALKSIEYILKDKRSLRMLIWTNYYSKAVNELAGRVLGDKVITGVYKITNNETGQVYVGQARDMRSRWRDHAKCGLDIDRPSTSKFYKNMLEYGLENFTFELQEKCSAEKLNEREKYWIAYFQANTFGLNGNQGNNS